MAPVDGGGNSTRPGPIPVTGQVADAPQVNVPVDDIYSILNLLMFVDGRKPLRGNIVGNNYKFTGAANATNPQDYTTLSQIQELLANIESVPPGSMQHYTVSSTIAPAGWLFANGQSVLRASYPALWAALQNPGSNLAATQGAKTAGQYGPGNGTTTFTLPDLYADSGYFIRAMTTGRAIGNIQTDALGAHAHTASFAGAPVPAHRHDMDWRTGNKGGPYVDAVARAGGSDDAPGSGNGANVGMAAAGGHTPTGTVTVTSTGGTETRPKNIAYPVLIKT